MNSVKTKLKQYYAIFQIRRHGFWFVDIPRTSSSSIRAELGKFYGIPYGKSNTFDKKHSSPQIFKDHLPAKRMRQILGPEIWDRIFTFTFVRNPWDRIVSIYNWRRKIGKISHELTFRDYILELKRAHRGTGGDLFNYYGHYYGSCDYILGKNDEIIVDFIGKYENRERDIKEIARQIGFKELGNLVTQEASPSRKHYSEYYDELTREIVEQIYRKDLDLFGYEFEQKS